jgi:hypothetical protein
MRRTSLFATFAAVAVCSAAFAWPGGGGADGFRLPDASAACRVEGATLVCRSLGVRSGLALAGTGTPRAVDAPVWWDAGTPVLRHWSQNGIDCRAAGGSILCRNEQGASISLGPAQIAVGL